MLELTSHHLCPYVQRAPRLGLNGFLVNSHTGDLNLDDPRFAPVLEAAQALDRPIYLHPRSPSNGMAAPFADYSMGGSIWGFGFEAAHMPYG